MKKILCPTDLEHIDKIALEYALQVGEKYGSEVILFHAVASGKQAEVKTEASGNTDPEDPVAFMDKVAGDLQAEIGTHTAFRSQIVNGAPVHAIVQAAEDEEVDLVVITPHLRPSPEKPLLGSTTLGVLEHIRRPVMIVPEAARFTGISQIGYVTNFEEGDFKIIDRLLHLAQQFQATLHCVHIRPQTEYWDHKQREMYERLYLMESTNNMVKMHVIKKEMITKALIEFIDEESIDVLALLTSHPQMLRDIYRDSRSYKLSLHTTIPVLAFQV